MTTTHGKASYRARLSSPHRTYHPDLNQRNSRTRPNRPGIRGVRLTAFRVLAALRRKLLELFVFRKACSVARVGSVRRECLDHIIILGRRHLAQVLGIFSRDHFNRAGPHQGIRQRVPVAVATEKLIVGGTVTPDRQKDTSPSQGDLQAEAMGHEPPVLESWLTIHRNASGWATPWWIELQRSRATIAQVLQKLGTEPHAFPNATKLHLDLGGETPKVLPFCGRWDRSWEAESDCNHPIVG